MNFANCFKYVCETATSGRTILSSIVYTGEERLSGGKKYSFLGKLGFEVRPKRVQTFDMWQQFESACELKADLMLKRIDLIHLIVQIGRVWLHFFQKRK